MTLSIECVLQYKSFPNAAELWTLLAATHPALAAAQDPEMSQDQKSFGIQFESGEIHFCPVANHRLDRLDIEGMPNSVAGAEDWLSPLLGDPRFIQARIYDEDYDFWQNAFDPLQFEHGGRSIADLKMVSNGLPHPLTQDIVDTSMNPGRSTLRTGFIESVGSVMWLGNGLWDLMGRTVPDWLRIPTLQVDRREGFVRIQAAEQPFISGDGAAGKLQVAMRKLIFGTP